MVEKPLSEDRIMGARQFYPGGTIVRSFRAVNGFFRRDDVDDPRAAALSSDGRNPLGEIPMAKFI
jgi:hypothetical protein